jgi:hypothetical protein
MKTNKLLATAFALVSFATAAFCETYAVCMGVNDYPIPTDATGNPFKNEKGEPVDNKLKGCVNDATAYRDLLKSKYNVKESNIKLLTDKEVTGDKFLEAMKWLIQSAKAGDHVFFQFSGHGSQIPNKEKVSGKQSVIVLQDMRLVTSDFFKELGPLLKDSGISSTFLFDSCFAGGMSRNNLGLTLTGLESIGVDFKNPFTIQSAKGRVMLSVPKQATTVATKSLNSLQMQVKNKGMALGSEASTCFVFASSADQTSADVSGPNIKSHGLFTLVLTAVLNEEPKLPLGDTISAIADLLAEKKFTQTPNVEATSADRVQLGLLPL